MATIKPTAGAKFYIGPALATAPVAVGDVSGLTYTLVNKTETFGAFGDSAQIVTFDSTNDDRRDKVKGTRDAGDWSITVGRVAGDPGQLAMAAAQATSQEYITKLVLDDEPINGTKPTTFYVWGLVTQARSNPAGANSVFRTEYMIAIKSAPIEDPAA